MDETQHLIASSLQSSNLSFKEMIKKMDIVINLLQDSLKIQKEQLSFFVAIDKRELGLDDTNAQEYLTELKKDGFEPKSE